MGKVGFSETYMPVYQTIRHCPFDSNLNIHSHVISAVYLLIQIILCGVSLKISIRVTASVFKASVHVRKSVYMLLSLESKYTCYFLSLRFLQPAIIHPTWIKIFSLAPYTQMPSIFVLRVILETKFETRTELKARRQRFWANPFSRTRPWGLLSLSTRSRKTMLLGSRALPLRRAYNLSAISQPYMAPRPVTEITLPFPPSCLQSAVATHVYSYLHFEIFCTSVVGGTGDIVCMLALLVSRKGRVIKVIVTPFTAELLFAHL
jgi:hypothetical protein